MSDRLALVCGECGVALDGRRHHEACPAQHKRRNRRHKYTRRELYDKGRADATAEIVVWLRALSDKRTQQAEDARTCLDFGLRDIREAEAEALYRAANDIERGDFDTQEKDDA